MSAPAFPEVIEALREADRSRMWGEIHIVLRAGRPTLLRVNKTHTLNGRTESEGKEFRDQG